MQRHFRGGSELPELNRDDHYSTHFQEIRALREPRRVMPVYDNIQAISRKNKQKISLSKGDNLVTTCWYDTRSKSNVTLGGYGFDDEMCVNYVHYYPRYDFFKKK